MRHLSICFVFALLLSASSLSSAFAAEKPGNLRHVVCLKFKEGAKPEEIKKAEAAFRDLKNKIKEVISLEWGLNTSKEGKNKGFTHCFTLTFVDEKELAAYVVHADHQAFAKGLGPIIDDVFVIDYHAKE